MVLSVNWCNVTSLRPGWFLPYALYSGHATHYTGIMIYDVSLPLSPELAVWPGDPAITREEFGDQVKVSRWTLGSHAGTHVDAPRHYSAGPGTVDALDPELLVGPCRILDVTGDALITAEVLARHDLRGVTRLLLHTRNSLRRQADLTTFDPDFIGLDAGAARVLLDAGIRLLGVDGPSVEPYAGDGTVHGRLLAAGVIIIESLNLNDVPAGDYTLICAPLPLHGADGAPARVFLHTSALSP